MPPTWHTIKRSTHTQCVKDPKVMPCAAQRSNPLLVTQQPILRRFCYTLMPIQQFEDGPKPGTLRGENLVQVVLAHGGNL